MVVANQDFLNAFNDSVDRINAGQTVEDCMRLYPRHAAVLRPLLETGRLIDRLSAPSLEVEQAKTRGRMRLEEALRAPLPQKRTTPFRPYLNLAAAVLVIVFVATFGAGNAAQSSLPGDTLYGLKQITEGVQLSLSGDPALRASFNERRQDEIKQILAMNRVADVAFEGTVTVITGTTWLVDELPLQVAEQTAGAAGIAPGDVVRVVAATTSGGELKASEITLIETGDQPPLPTPSATLIPSSSTPRPTETATLTPTPSPTVTNEPDATATITAAPTQTRPVVAVGTATMTAQPPTAVPSATPRPTRAPSQTPLPTRTATLIPTPISPTVCATMQPSNWNGYRVQVGDTLSGLAANRGITLEQLMQINCLTDPRFIVVGDLLILPRASSTATDIPEDAGTIGTQEDNGSSNDNSNDSSSDNSSVDDNGGGSSNDNSNDNSGVDDSGGTDNSNDNSGVDDNGGHGSDG
jgi:LysM repeat protein